MNSSTATWAPSAQAGPGLSSGKTDKVASEFELGAS